jgi:hypothetical protein
MVIFYYPSGKIIVIKNIAERDGTSIGIFQQENIRVLENNNLGARIIRKAERLESAKR